MNSSLINEKKEENLKIEIKSALESKNIFHLRDIIYDTNEVILANIFEKYFSTS